MVMTLLCELPCSGVLCKYGHVRQAKGIPSPRTLKTNKQTGFIFGELVLALEAYLIRDWVTLQLVAYLPMLILLGLYFILPESTRWLIARGETE
jgi:hypothetical protein